MAVNTMDGSMIELRINMQFVTLVATRFAVSRRRWGSLEHGPSFITPCWVNGSHPRLQKSLWLNGAEAVSISAAHHPCQGDVEAVLRRASIFSSQAEVIYNDDGSVTVDVRQAIDAGVSNGPYPVFAASERIDERWIIHAELSDITWLRDRRGEPYNLGGAVFAKAAQWLQDALSWTKLRRGVANCKPVLDMSTASIAARRHFGSLCLAILYNFPQLLFRYLEPGALLAYTPTIHQCHDWVISDDGSTVTHFDAGMPRDSMSVSSMFELIARLLPPVEYPYTLAPIRG
uniref:Uncharacterized protein n=1 Tax=Hyaloperonospora arabidopsidis (strain Emoy2) TaxID=559515 RepID=M4BSW1_HYAAE